MSPSIAVLGSGPGLGRSVARRWAQEGYDVALVARRTSSLEQEAAALVDVGVGVEVNVHRLPADLADTAAVPALAERIRGVIGEPDVLYYGAAPNAFGPVTELTPSAVDSLLPLAVRTPIALANEFVPAMLARGDGAFVTAQGAGGVQGMPWVAGGLAIAAQRNYVQAMAAAVADRGVYFGGLYIGAVIRRSAYHAQHEQDIAAGRPVPDMPGSDPDRLADVLFEMCTVRAGSDVVDRGDQPS